VHRAIQCSRRSAIFARVGCLDDVICDPDARRLIALRPKPAFRLLFRQVRGLVERDGIFEINEGVGYNSGDKNGVRL
jgi:hypothetical protein